MSAALRSNSPSVHAALLPYFSDIMKSYAAETTASYFLDPARALVNAQNLELFLAAKPHFAEALKRATWATQNFGNLACNWLDMGGEPEALIEPLKIVLDSQQADAEDSFMRQSREAKLGKHLCQFGFIRLLNHPRIQENSTLYQMTFPFAGSAIEDKSGSEPVAVLTAIQGGAVGIFWSPYMEYARYAPVNHMLNLKWDFIKGASSADVAQVAQNLFEQQAKIPRRDISTQAHRAAKMVGAEFRQDYAAQAQRHAAWARSEASLGVLEI